MNGTYFRRRIDGTRVLENDCDASVRSFAAGYSDTSTLPDWSQLYRYAIVDNARLRARVAELEARLKEYEAQS